MGHATRGASDFARKALMPHRYRIFGVCSAGAGAGPTPGGVSTSFLSLEGSDFASLNALYRYYPRGAALSGFFLGGRVGSYHVSDEGESGEALGLGFEDAAQRQLLCRAPGTSGFRTRPAIVHNAR
jgi:hypothetical protein